MTTPIQRRSTREVSQDGTYGNGGSVTSTVTPQSALTWSVKSNLSLMDELESEDESNTRAELIEWIRCLQDRVNTMEEQTDALEDEIKELKTSAETATSEMLGHTQVECHRDARTYRKINALVVDKIFAFKKFIISQRDLDDFHVQNSLGMIIMDRMKVEEPDRLPFWNAYKEIVADAIANRRTTITNDLKKVVMSKYRMNDMVNTFHVILISSSSFGYGRDQS